MGKVFKALSKAESSDTVVGREENVPESSLPDNGSTDEVGANPLTPRQENVRPWEGENTTGAQNNWDEKLVAFSAPSSPLAENFRRLRTKILHPSSGRPLKKILVTSAESGAGKSFVCANLGISLAQGVDQHALLVDCDLRRSRLGELFGVSNDFGLTDHLREGVDLGRLIVKTGLHKLAIIPGGPKPANPAELLGSEKAEQMFAELDGRYDDRFIIIDTPPSMFASEATVLTRNVDGVILVVRWGGADRDRVKQLADSIAREKIIGVVFNAYEDSILSAKLSGYDEYGAYDGSYGKSK